MADKPDPLSDYRRKRNFAVTSEPDGEAAPAAASKALSFVIQKHAARALHYDFRLELDGSLKSWAVPKGPSLDPQDKRMAVHVEDHPLGYANFEGVIPPGQYGAGTVIVWDRGVWLPVGDARAGYKAGKLKFELRGEKLHGHWTLVRMRGRGKERQEPWLLIKERDEAARPAAAFNVVEVQPDSVIGHRPAAAPKAARAAKSRPATALPVALAPQLATLVDQAPTEGDWLWELKFDGYRLLCRVDGADVRLFTRNGHDWTPKLKGLAQAIGQLQLGSAWLDGEIVVLDKAGVPNFQALQNAFDAGKTDSIVYCLFDLPFHAGEDLREQPLRARRERLRGLLDGATSDKLRFSEDFPVAPDTLLHTVCQLRMEGLIGKRADSPYQSRRSADWIKLKCTLRQEFVIAGYTDPKGSRVGLGALMLAVHDDAGTLRYAGNVGTGFSAGVLTDLVAQLAPLQTETAPFKPVPTGVRGHWVKPKLVAEVSFAEWTKDGRVRHAVFHGLRSDKPTRTVTHEKAAPVKTASAKTAPAKPARPAALPAGVKLTHGQRVIDPSSGITKQELAEFYARVAVRLLPHLKARPASLVRGPEGVGGELFFQKHGEGLKIPGLRLLDTALDPGHAPLLEVTNARALLGAVQMNVIEFHTWNAKARAIDKPDRMTFDLDPGEGVPWQQVQEAAQLVQALLQELSLIGFLKTSGGKGLHVVVPFKPALEWAAVRGLSQAIVQHLAATLPQRFVAKSGPKNRVGKIFVDYLRNGRGATTVSAWSARARPGMGVSIPVAWDELPTLSSGAHWTVRTAAERLELADPWADMGASGRQTLSKAMKTLDDVALAEPDAT